MKNFKVSVILLLIIAVATVFGANSCKRYVDPPPYFEPEIDTTKPPARKLLLIAIDGALSSEYKEMKLPTITSMLEHSKYTWDAVTDEISTDATSWKTLMSGLTYSSHQIKDSLFVYTQTDEESEGHETIKSYPSMFSYILSSARADMKTVFISPWGELVNRLVPEVQNGIVVTDDAVGKDSALNKIKNESPDFMVVNFNTPAIAGKAGAFKASDAGYKAAALKVDEYINEIMTALKARPGYNTTEEWLVVVASTHGGTGDTYGGSSLEETTGFILHYNEKFTPLEITKEGTYTGALITGNKGNAIKAVLSDPNAYDPGSSPMTFELKVRGVREGNYQPFFYKKGGEGSLVNNSSPGFVCWTNGSNWAMEVRGGGSDSRPSAGSLPVFDGSNWHTISMVFWADSIGKKWLQMYSDGVRGNQVDISTWPPITSTTPLTLGYGIGGSGGGVASHVKFNVADVRIFNTALTGAEIAQNLCLVDITKHPKYTNLTGYWPCNDGLGGRFKNLAPGSVNKDFILEGNYSWAPVTPSACSQPGVTDPGKKSLMLTNASFATTAFYWLRLTVNESWGFQGINWLQDYENEFINL